MLKEYVGLFPDERAMVIGSNCKAMGLFFRNEKKVLLYKILYLIVGR